MRPWVLVPLAACAVALALTGCSQIKRTEVVSEEYEDFADGDRFTYEKTGNDDVFVLVDHDTGVQYLVVSPYSNVIGAGSLLDSDGKPILADSEE